MHYIVIVVILFFVIHYFAKSYKNKEVQVFPAIWKPILLEKVKFYKGLDADRQIEFQNRMMQFLAVVGIEAVQFELEDVDRVLIAASAIVPVFGFEEWHYNYLSTVILYPNYFNQNLYFDGEAENKNIAGMVGTGIYENKMILSRKALHHGFANPMDKKNTAIHEFVHLIDKEDGLTDGIPENLWNNNNSIPWLDLIHKKMEKINNNKSDIRNYGGTSQVEFFAVAAEYFFERPKLMERKHPELYKMLKDCFEKREV
ncbi:MAG: Mlc titration factor MtfA (ptsG expression regulator) [Vicingaceae bacterium]|jgi:Mlc titration factor MtfA (ptsG expression regulator)